MTIKNTVGSILKCLKSNEILQKCLLGIDFIEPNHINFCTFAVYSKWKKDGYYCQNKTAVTIFIKGLD